MFVKPGMHINADGKEQLLVVRLPDRRLMPPEGMEVDEHDLAIARLLRDRDIVAAERPVSPKAEPAAA